MHKVHTHSRVKKVRVGISFDHEVVESLDNLVTASPDLSTDRSEIVNALAKFFLIDKVSLGGNDVTAETRKLLIRGRTLSNRTQGSAGTS